MGKQFDRLVCEKLKEYYEKNFKEFKKLSIVVMEVGREKARFIERLYIKLQNKFSKQKNHLKKRILDEELRKILNEADSSVKIDKQISLVTAEPQMSIFEAKLDFIEDELNKKGITVKIIDGNVMFEEKQGKAQEKSNI